MKKKISVFALLLSLVLSFSIPVPVAAASESNSGIGGFRQEIFDMMKTIPSELRSQMDTYGYVVYGKSSDSICTVRIFDRGGSVSYFRINYDGRDRIVSYNSDGAQVESTYYWYNSDREWVYGGYGSEVINSSKNDCLIYASSCDLLYGRDGEIISDDIPSISEYLGESVLYSFPSWCVDAGLNCQASTYESNTVLPYSFNDYIHIVRRTGTGKYGRYILTTIGNSVIGDNLSDYTLMVDENGVLQVFALYSGEDNAGYQLFARNYEYDTDGWKLVSLDLFDTRNDDDLIIELGEEFCIDDYSLLAYSSVDIYSSDLNLVYEASTEFVDITDILPDVPDTPDEPDTPTPTPTTTPGSGSSGGGRPGSGTRPDAGGQATGGGGLDFIINLFTMIWTDICSVNMSVDGYSINLQQIIVYGALVSIVGGFIMHFIFGRK